MFTRWRAELITTGGDIVQTTCLYPQQVLVSDGYRVFIRTDVVDQVIRFHEADLAVFADRAIVSETYRQLDMADP